MEHPVYCMIGSRAVKTEKTPDGGLAVLAYFPDEDEFRPAAWFLEKMDGADCEFLSREAFEKLVEDQRAMTA